MRIDTAGVPMRGVLVGNPAPKQTAIRMPGSLAFGRRQTKKHSRSTPDLPRIYPGNTRILTDGEKWEPVIAMTGCGGLGH